MVTPMLVSLEAVKADLNMDHNLSDAEITIKIRAASAIVMNYLKVPHDNYSDSTGNIPVIDSGGEPDVPEEVKIATMLMVRELYGDASKQSQWEHGFPPRAVMNILYPLRDPALG